MSSRVSIQQFVSNNEPTGAALGDEWYVPSTGLLYKRTAVNGTQTSWVNLAVVPSGGVSNQVLTYGANGALTWTTGGIPATYSGIFTITNTTPTVSTTAGALIVAGGAGIGGNLNIGGNVRTSRFMQSPYQPVAPRGLVNRGTGALTAITTASTGLQPFWLAVDPTGRFLYTANNGDSTVSQFAINTSTGVLTTVASAISATSGIARVIVDPTGRFAYATISSNRIYQYSINQTTGVLTSLGVVLTSETGGSTYQICVDPTGRFVYTGNFSNNFIRQFAINQTNGLLTQITTDISTGASTGPLMGIQVDPSGRFLYISYTNSSQLGQYAIDQTTGALTLIAAPVNAASSIHTIAIEPSGRFLYLTCTGTLFQYSIDQNSGALTQVTSLSGPSSNLNYIAIDPNGQFLYGVYSAGFVQYSINQQTGTLTQVALLLYSGTIFNLMVDPTGRFLYAINSSNSSVVLMTINSFAAGSGTISGNLNIAGTSSSISTMTGALQVVGGVGIGGALYVGGNLNIVGTLNGTTPGSVDASQNIRTNRFIQTAYQPAAPRSRVYQGTGVPSFVSTMTGTVTGSFGGMAIDPTGRFVYQVNDNNTTVSQFAINTSTGVLTTVSNAIAASQSIRAIVVEASGKYAYVLNAGGIRAVSQYSINQTTGVLTLLGTEFLGVIGTLYTMCTDPTGRYLFVSNFDTTLIRQYAISSSTGLLSSMGDTFVGAGQAQGADGAMIVDPTGRFLYVSAGSQVAQVSINQTTGALTSNGPLAFPGAPSVTYFAIEPSGRFLYASGDTSNQFVHYSINQTTGVLTQILSYSLSGSGQLIVDPNGLFLYVRATSGLNQYSINQLTGELTLRGLVGGTSFLNLKIDPTGRFMYTANGGSIHLYTLNNFSAGSGTISGILSIASTANAVSTVTGALQVAGGIGVGGSVYVANTGTFTGALVVGTATAGVPGEIRATNEITAYYSDRRLKENVQIIDNAVVKVLSLTGITYTPNAIAESYGYDRTKKLAGLFADEVAAVLPEAVRPAPFDDAGAGVSKSGENYQTIQYEKLIPLLIEAIKDQQQQIIQLKELINSLTLKE